MVAGTTLQGRYRLDRRLAAGGMGTVYEGHDKRLGRRVAVKLLKEELAGDPRFVERFRREARSVASLAHPNIANVYDYGEDAGRYFIVMQFADGEDLAALLRRDAPLDAGRAAAMAEGVCEALHHAHTSGIVHRDVKPANIIVGRDDLVVVTDFGIARAVGDSTLTAAGSVLGTAHYLSPEQASGGPVGPASDVYSLGIVLYEMLTGTVPFTADTPIAIAMRHVSDALPPPSSVNPSVPRAYDEIVARATAKDPAERFPDAASFAAALARARGVGAPVAPTAAMGSDTAEGAERVWPVPLERWDARRAGRAVLLGFLALAALAAGLLLVRALGTADDAVVDRSPRRAEEETGETSPTSTTTQPLEQLTVPEGIIGMPVGDAEKLLKDAGFHPVREEVEAGAEKDVVVDSDPEPGSPVRPGEQITLFVSTGAEDEEDKGDEGGPDNGGPPDVPPGQEKKEEDDD